MRGGGRASDRFTRTPVAVCLACLHGGAEVRAEISMTGGPLGKYSQLVAATVALTVIGSSIILRFLHLTDPFMDNMAMIALGAVFGAAASTAVNGDKIEAAHKRLDILSAPPADLLEHP